jgi:hypothetical protein
LDEFLEMEALDYGGRRFFDLAAGLDEGNDVGSLGELEQALSQEHEGLLDPAAEGLGQVALSSIQG